MMHAGGEWIIEIYSEDPFSIPGGSWVPVCEDLDPDFEDLFVPIRFKTFMDASVLMNFYFTDRVEAQRTGGTETVRVTHSPRSERLLN